MVAEVGLDHAERTLARACRTAHIVGTTMATRKRLRQAGGPVSVAINTEQRKRLAAEARRRGLGVSPTIRTLALERLGEIQEEAQVARARQWQLERAREIWDAIERGEVAEASWEDVEQLFDDALAEIRRRSGDARP